MKYAILDPSGGLLAHNCEEACFSCLKSLQSVRTKVQFCPGSKAFRRLGTRLAIGTHKVFMCSDDKALLKSRRNFWTEIQVLADAANNIIQLKERGNRDLAKVLAQTTSRAHQLTHNLTSLNAHSIQEIFDFLPQAILTKRYKDQLSVITAAVAKHPSDVARILLKLIKNNLEMKMEFTVFDRMFASPPPPPPQLHMHPIRDVVLNVLHTFTSDFAEKDVNVDVADSALAGFLDYETFHVALYPIIDNAAKYTKPKSLFEVRFEAQGEKAHVIFEMVSIRIMPHEVGRLCEEYYSGEIPRSLNMAGKGIGMNRATALLRLNNATLTINRNVLERDSISYKGAQYERNRITVALRGAWAGKSTS
jgi:hypothetical protein